MVTHINYNGGKEVSYQYNAVGDLVQMDDWTGTNTFEVDLLNRITAVTNEKGNKVTYEYDATGNQTRVGYPDGTSVTKTYDLVGNLESVVESDGRTTTYQYDGMRRLVHMNYPDGWQEDYTYDAVGQILSIYDTDPTGQDMKQQKNKFEYDACGNMTYEYMRGNGTGGATTEVFYTYDELHQVVTAKENYGNKTRTYQYDSLGNLTYETNSNNVQYDYKLNNLNQLVEKTYSKGKEHTVYTYDGRGNLVEEEYGKNKKTATVGAYTFDETNRMVLGVNADSESSAYIFNGLGALVEQTWTIKKNSYGYHDGSEAAVLTAQGGVETESGADAEAQTAAPVPDTSTALLDELDAMGDPAAALDAELGIMPLKNDHSGKKPDDKPGHKPNQMITVVKQFFPDYTRETLDPLVENEVGGLEYRYVYGNERLSVNITGIENGAGSIVENGNQVRLYYHQDLRGTVDYLTSPVSQKIESWTHYNEWGEITHNAVLKCGQRQLDLVKNYTGHEYDAVLNLYFAKARFYDAENRRFISMDPVKGSVKDPISMVQYLYVKNAPLIYTDPTGEKYSLAQGTVAHAEITAYIKSIEPTAKGGVKIVGLTRTKSGHGFADIIIENGGDHDVYEIKSDQYEVWGRYNAAAINQLDSYINAITNYPVENAAYYPARKGVAVITTPVYLPYLLDRTKVIRVYTKYNKYPGLIFYEIMKAPQNKQVVPEESFVTASLLQTVSYYGMVTCEYPPAYYQDYINVDSYLDQQMNDDIQAWLDGATVSTYTEGLNIYTKIVYADGTEFYRYEGLGVPFLTTTPKLSGSELLTIREGGTYNQLQGWASSAKEAFNLQKAASTVPVLPLPGGGVVVPVV